MALAEVGYVDGRNVALEYRWAEGEYGRLPALANELVERRITVMVTVGGTPSAVAAKTAVTTIPVVFLSGADPVRLGLVASLNRPGGNFTGIGQFTTGLTAKRLELLKQLVPNAQSVAALLNPKHPNAEAERTEVQDAARTLGLRLRILTATSDPEIAAAFAHLGQQPADALVVQSDPFLDTRRERLVARAARHAIPSIYGQREYAAAGGLASYGTDFADTYRQAGVYAGRILRGEKPSDLPVAHPTKFKLVINLAAARALGIDMPPTLLARADEVIE